MSVPVSQFIPPSLSSLGVHTLFSMPVCVSISVKLHIYTYIRSAVNDFSRWYFFQGHLFEKPTTWHQPRRLQRCGKENEAFLLLAAKQMPTGDFTDFTWILSFASYCSLSSELTIHPQSVPNPSDETHTHADHLSQMFAAPQIRLLSSSSWTLEGHFCLFKIGI